MSVPAKVNLDLSRKWFTEAGVTISVWASENGFSRDLVYSVLLGRVKGTRGEAFEIRKKLLELAGVQAETAGCSSQEHTGAIPSENTFLALRTNKADGVNKITEENLSPRLTNKKA